MAETVKDGGPAFAYGNHEQGGHSGMSLRDWFAGQALPVVAAVLVAPGIVTDDGQPASSKHVARAAYDIADAMLEARSK